MTAIILILRNILHVTDKTPILKSEKKIKLQKLKQLKIRHWRIKDLGGLKWKLLKKA